ncbi:MAG: response regulator transcription factor [Bacteroidetes bacterium]|nr:response regulator transcription factor [Bacteroidota bacterium]
MKIKTVVIDDEINNVEALCTLLQYLPDIEISGKFTESISGLRYINENPVDLLFLDIQMPDLTGFDIVERISGQKPEIVFVTAHSDAAVKAFRLAATDFLVKPVIFSELKNTVERVGLKLRERKTATKSQRISFHSQSGIDIVDISQILYFMGTGSYTEVFLSDMKKITVSKNLGEFESMSALRNFLRIHTSYLVNTSHIEKFIKEDGGMVMMKNGVMIPVSRRKKEELIEWLKSLQGEN